MKKIHQSGEPGEIYIGDVSPTDFMCAALDDALKKGILKRLVVGDHHVTRAYLADKYDWYYYNKDHHMFRLTAEVDV